MNKTLVARIINLKILRLVAIIILLAWNSLQLLHNVTMFNQLNFSSTILPTSYGLR
jgi:hypothetical protein